MKASKAVPEGVSSREPSQLLCSFNYVALTKPELKKRNLKSAMKEEDVAKRQEIVPNKITRTDRPLRVTIDLKQIQKKYQNERAIIYGWMNDYAKI